MTNLEYIVTKGDVLVIIKGETPFFLISSNSDIIDSEIEYIKTEFPEALKALELRYHQSRHNVKHFKFLIVRQWIKCHYGQVDHLTDVEFDGQRNFETSYCPKRGECESCDLFKVCYPVRTSVLSTAEVSVLRLLVAGLDVEQIADTLCKSFHTITKHKSNMLKRLGLHKTSQLIDYWNKNGMK